LSTDSIWGQYPPSPVPSDMNLAEGELPFTAFGQFGEGKMDNRVFEQDKYWVNVKGEAFLLEEMDDLYRRNVINFLHDNLDYFHAMASLRDAIGMLASLEAGEPDGSALAFALGAPAIVDIPPTVWLESTPLMRKLRELTN